MDKASVIKDSINYMQELIDQEKRLEAEIRELESRSTLLENPIGDYDCINNFLENQQQDLTDINVQRSKKFKKMDYNTLGSSSTRVHKHSPIIEVLEVSTMHFFGCTLKNCTFLLEQKLINFKFNL